MLKDEFVYRPSDFWTPQIHLLLKYLKDRGFDKIPTPIQINDDYEVVSYLKGEVCNYPLSLAAKSPTALISAAKLLRQYHDVSASFINDNNLKQNLWQIPIHHPVEVICHNDYAPYNIVMQDNKCIGIIDFDCAAPSPRIWDISYALYRYAPFTNPSNCDGFGNIKEQAKRARLFCDSYDLNLEARSNLPELIIERLHSLIDFMFNRAKRGDQNFKDNIINKHHITYKQDIDYITLNKEQIRDGLIKST